MSSKYKMKKLNISSLKEAQKAIAKTGACEQSIPLMAPKLIFLCLKLQGVRSPVANILKQEALSIGAEAAVSQHTVNCSKPSSDVILAGTLKQLKKLAAKMKMQGYGLPQPAAEDYKSLSEELSDILEEYKN